jgi:SAM-dependent methyltransferase
MELVAEQAQVDLTDAPEWRRLGRDHQWQIHEHAFSSEGIWHTGLTSSISFPDDAHDELFEIEEHSFWFRHRNRVIAAALARAAAPRVIWEIGAGNGCVARHLQERGYNTVAVEPLLAGARNARRRGINSVVCGQFEMLELPAGSLPAIGCFDVLEHLERPDDLVAECYRTLAPGGLCIVTLPALGWLWSDADVVAGHFRRYTRNSLERLLAGAGFEIETLQYFMAAMVAPLFCLRTLPSLWRRDVDRMRTLQRCQQQMVPRNSKRRTSIPELLLNAESCLARVCPLPIGTSVLGVARKPS